MGLLSHRVKRSDIKPGDHIYTYEIGGSYSHHGIYVGDGWIVDYGFRGPPRNPPIPPPSSSSSSSSTTSPCPTYPDQCGSVSEPNNTVRRTCIDCFLRNGYPRRYEYGVPRKFFLTKFRGGTFTTAHSDLPETVVHRAMYLLDHGFGNYDLLANNCEDFAVYCKTGLVINRNLPAGGRSGQVTSFLTNATFFVWPLALSFFMPFPIGATTLNATQSGMTLFFRFCHDMGVREDVIKVEVEDLAETVESIRLSIPERDIPSPPPFEDIPDMIHDNFHHYHEQILQDHMQFVLDNIHSQFHAHDDFHAA